MLAGIRQEGITMVECSTATTARRFSPRAGLAAVGLRLRQVDLFGPIRSTVAIAQKTVRHTPAQKLYDAFIAVLAGAHGLVEINTRLRSDPALQAAFGRAACAEQSVVQETLDACTAENVTQLEQAVDIIYRQHSQGYRHDYAAAWQVLDADMSGLPCGPKAACATKGYFAHRPNRRGRQLGRVVASRYDEVVVDRLFAGTTQLSRALQPLVLAAEQTLELDESRRARTILRVDAGGGSLADVNWALERGYRVHGKDYSTRRATTLAASVTAWVDDPRTPGRQVGWVTLPPTEYARPVCRVAVRCRKKTGDWGYGVVVSALQPRDVILLTGQPLDRVGAPEAVLLAYVYFYDQRGGACETANKGDKQGLGLTRRNKRRFEAQQMLMLLGTLAHNVLIWARHWLAPRCPVLARYGPLRLVRDVGQISGFLLLGAGGQTARVVLNQAAPLAPGLVAALGVLLADDGVAVSLGET
jgi:hypothetical protein